MTTGPQRAVAIVSNSVSAKYGGEAVLPLHYFRKLRGRGVKVFLICHERTLDELTESLGADVQFVHFIRDSKLHVLLDRIGNALPKRLLISHLIAWDVHRYARGLIRELVKTHGVSIVHQPSPVSPKFPSNLMNLGVPVVIGPMNGGMTYPPGFGKSDSIATGILVRIGRGVSNVMNRVISGKHRAALLLVANARTREALPVSHDRVMELVENGVDLLRFKRADSSGRESLAKESTVTFLFAGRFEPWKGLDLLLRAWGKMMTHSSGQRACSKMHLRIIGDGADRGHVEQLRCELGIKGSVTLEGFMPQEEVAKAMREADVFVLPSYYECGGAVILEAMASVTPCIALKWGGPADYLDNTCGILITPTSRQQVIDDLARAMTDLANHPERRRSMGEAGLTRATNLFDWERKIDQILEIYEKVGANQRETAIG